jgi:hypothetical protein
MSEDFDVVWNGTIDTASIKAQQQAAAPTEKGPGRIEAGRLCIFLVTHGAHTVEELSVIFQSDSHGLNAVLYALRQQGMVQLVERRRFRNKFGHHCGKWQATQKAAFVR